LKQKNDGPHIDLLNSKVITSKQTLEGVTTPKNHNQASKKDKINIEVEGMPS